MAACKRAVQLGASSGLSLTKLRRFNATNASSALEKVQLDGFLTNFGSSSSSNFRQISQLAKSNGKRVFLVDTLALVISSVLSLICCLSAHKWKKLKKS